jgi:mono/diheme cytochrome c family protein
MRVHTFALAALLQTSQADTPFLPSNAANGARLFQAIGCYSCHGTTGGGGGIAGPTLAPDPIPYPSFLAKLRVRSGRMPIYPEALLSDVDAANLYSYLQSIPSGKSANEIPLLRDLADDSSVRQGSRERHPGNSDK